MSNTENELNTLHTKYYSLKPLPLDIKEIFELPADPITEDETDRQLVFDYFRKYSIFFYQDEELNDGIIIDQNDGVRIEDQNGFQAFKHSCMLASNNLHVADWEDLNDPKVQQKGPKAWLEWNKPVIILRVSPKEVVLG